MISWHKAPLIRVLIPFLTGIILAAFIDADVPFIKWVLPLLFLIVIYSAFKKSFIGFSAYGISLWVFLFFAGYEITYLNSEQHYEDHYIKHLKNASAARGLIDEPLNEKATSFKTVIRVKYLLIDAVWVPVSGKSLAYIKKDDRSFGLNTGDQILFNPRFANINPPKNTHEFNYKRYLFFHQVYQQVYLPAESWKKIAAADPSNIFAIADKCRKKLLSVFKANGLKGDEYAVVSALIVGYEDDIKEHLIQAYSSTGALHVLSVSGMHVAIIYVFLTYLLRSLTKWKYGNLQRALILVCFLWGYALITGLSPSVQRAAMMFSFVAVGTSFNRYTNIYNTLAGSALVLLITNPFLVMEVGFQLSYLAVIGIVYLQPKISSLYESDSWLLKNIWLITAVSISAQIATFPLGLLYFHQFPNYFLLSNLVVIPLSNFIIYLGIVVFAVAPLPAIAHILTVVLYWLTKGLNESVQYIEKWPYALMDGISISTHEAFLIYGIILFLIAFFAKKNLRFLKVSLYLSIIALVLQSYESFVQSRQRKFVVYSISKTSALDFIYGRKNIFIAAPSLLADKNKIRFHIKNNWISNGIEETHSLPLPLREDPNSNSGLFRKENFLYFDDMRIVLIDSGFKVPPQNHKIYLDYLILSGNSNTTISELLLAFNPKMIIFDSSNTNYYIDKWINECSSKNLPCYDVRKGAYINVL